MIPDNLPILCVCGSKNSGKTALIERAIPHLRDDGLIVAAAKHAGEVHIETGGKDSDRFFRAGAEVLLQGPHESYLRSRRVDSPDNLFEPLEALARRSDIVLVEGQKSSPYAKVWLEGKNPPAPGIKNVIATLPAGEGRDQAFADVVEKFLAGRLEATPVYGCVLIGGSSRRMGAPKHLIKKGDVTLLQRTCELLEKACQKVVIAGGGQIPDALAGYAQLPDAPQADGPLAGIISAMRWSPQASWVVVACDMPNLSNEALHWLLAKRAPGTWAVMGKLHDAEQPEPLPAWYDFRCRNLLENRARRGEFKLIPAADKAKIFTPEIPAHLRDAWTNANTPGQLGGSH